jgi:hypothetical protein
MTFKEYILGMKLGGYSVQHFVSEAQRDPTFPDASTWEELQTYLEGRGAQPLEISQHAGIGFTSSI